MSDYSPEAKRLVKLMFDDLNRAYAGVVQRHVRDMKMVMPEAPMLLAQAALAMCLATQCIGRGISDAAAIEAFTNTLAALRRAIDGHRALMTYEEVDGPPPKDAA